MSRGDSITEMSAQEPSQGGSDAGSVEQLPQRAPWVLCGAAPFGLLRRVFAAPSRGGWRGHCLLV